MHRISVGPAPRDWAEAMRPHEARRVESVLSRRVRQSLGLVRLLFLSLGRMYILFFEMCTLKTRPLTCTFVLVPHKPRGSGSSPSPARVTFCAQVNAH